MGLLDKAFEEMHDDPVPWMHLLAQAKRSLGYELYDAGKHFCQLLYFLCLRRRFGNFAILL